MTLLESLGTDETERYAKDMEQDLPSGDLQTANRDYPNPLTLHIEGTDDLQPSTVETNEKAIILDGMAVVHELHELRSANQNMSRHSTGFRQSN